MKGIVWGKSFSAEILAPVHGDAAAWFGEHRYTLGGSARTLSGLPEPVLPGHPDYEIGIPGGCLGCSWIHADFTPYADPADVRRLMDFDLSCLTRWTPCLDHGDIMPAAWKQYTAEEGEMEQAEEQFNKCQAPLEFRGRDTRNAVVVDVVASRTANDLAEPLQIADMRLVQRLKGASFWKLKETQTVQLWDSQISRTSHNAVRDVLPGRQFILLFSHQSWQSVQVDRFGAMPLTRENLAEVQRGIDQDHASRLP